jgi:CRISPR/Cas system type I-B associated protein Csh2 (Cas7 group RAMP superfamily)
MTKKSKKSGTSTISIPTPLYKKLEKRAASTGFGSVSDYAVYVLREVVSGEERAEKKSCTKEDEEKIKERLRALGYLG